MSSQDFKRDFLNRTINDLGFSTRIITGLTLKNIEFMFEALRMTEAEFKHTPEIGSRSVSEFKEVISQYGFKMGATAPFFEKNKNLTITYGNIEACVDAYLEGTNSMTTSISLEDMKWIIPFLPENLRNGVKGEFLTAAIGTEEFKATIEPYVKAIEKAAVAEIQKALGFDKT